MKRASVKRNYVYNLTYQLVSLLTPLITTPYVARVLTSEGTGKFSFAASISSYFLMLAELGFSFHAQREVARWQDNIQEQSKTFWEIVICKSLSGLISFAGLWVIIFLGAFCDYSLLLKILSIEVLSSLFNVTFFFQGNEEFGIVTLRNLFFKLISILLIFCFVKNREDLWIYTLCHAGSSLLSSLSLWPSLKKRLVKIRIHDLKPQRHMIPSIKLFIPTIAISLFTILDKTLIGILVPGEIETTLSSGSIVVSKIADLENGYYAQSEKIVKMAMMVIASLGTVMMPRNAKVLEEGRQEVFLNNIQKSIEYVFFIGAPITAGIIAISKNFSPWFFGPGYEKVPLLLIIFAFMVIPSGLGNVFGQQYLIPKGEDNKYTITYVSTGIINLFLNLILIPRFLSYGAAVASVVAEIFAPILMLFFLRGKVSLTRVVKHNWKPVVSAILMFFIVYFSSKNLVPTINNTILLFVEGVIAYFVISLLIKSKVAYESLQMIKRRRIVGGKDGEKR